MGIVDRHGYNGQQKNTLFVILVSQATRFEAHRCQFFTKFNGFVVLTSPSGAYRTTMTTQPIILPLAHVREVITNSHGML